MEIRYGQITVATCTLNVHGVRNAEKHALVLTVGMSVFDYPPALADEGPPRSDVCFEAFVGELETPVGRVSVTPLFEKLALVAQPRTLVFRADLDHEHVRRIDDVRLQTRDVRLSLFLQVLVSDPESGRTASVTRLQTVVSESDWLKILADTGFDERFSAEFVIEQPEQSEGLARAAAEWKSARTCFRRGDWTGTLVYCRRAAEVLDVPTNLVQQRQDVETREKNLWASFGLLLHAGAHPGIGAPSRRHARIALLLTAELLDQRNGAARNA